MNNISKHCPYDRKSLHGKASFLGKGNCKKRLRGMPYDTKTRLKMSDDGSNGVMNPLQILNLNIPGTHTHM